MDKVYKPQIV